MVAWLIRKQIIQLENLKNLFVGSPANPMYGLSWWLNRPMDDQLRSSIRTLTMASDLRYGAPGVPNDLADGSWCWQAEALCHTQHEVSCGAASRCEIGANSRC